MADSIRLVYFAALAQTLGSRGETYTLSTPKALADVRAELIQRGPPWDVLAGSHIKAAVNHEMAHAMSQVNPGDEVAFFPPVTGG
jgi:sulfur-carrier protein